MKSMQITERTVGDVTILDLKGRLILDDGFEPMRVAFNEAIAEGRTKLLLNFQGVTHLDSAGVGLIAFKYVTMCRHDGQLRLCQLQPRTYKVLNTTKLLTVFKPFVSEADALKSFD
jgi:anti-anti-sigma factor